MCFLFSFLSLALTLPLSLSPSLPPTLPHSVSPVFFLPDADGHLLCAAVPCTNTVSRPTRRWPRSRSHPALVQWPRT